AARHLQQRGERRAELHFEVARALHVAGHGEDLGAAIVGLAQLQERLAAMLHDPWNRGKGLRVIDRRRLAVDAEGRRERRLEARLPFLAFERLEQRRFLAADVSAEAVVVVQVEREVGAQYVRAQEPGG